MIKEPPESDTPNSLVDTNHLDVHEKLDEILQKLPKKDRQEMQMIVQEMQWNAPYLPPPILEHFNKITPDGAMRVMEHMNKEQEHRHHCQRQELSAKTIEIKTIAHCKKSSLWLGFVSLLVMIIAIAVCDYMQLDKAVFALGSVTAFGLVGKLIQMSIETYKKS